MTQRGEEQIEKLCEEATCPKCEYSLRGLPGEMVTCPECGQLINIVRLVTTQWKGPWYKAPMYDELAIPVGWTILIAVAIYFTGFSFRSADFYLTYWHIMAMVPGLAGLGGIAWKVRQRFGDLEAYWLTLLLHVVLGLYLSCAYVVYLESMRFWNLLSFFSGVSILRQGMILLGLVIVVFLAKRLERHVGTRCIRRYFRLKAGS